MNLKKFIVVAVLSFLVVGNVWAIEERLTFKGIPIEGSLASFTLQLKTKGFTQISKEKTVNLFKGNFTGKTAIIEVMATQDGKSVQSVFVHLDPSGDWNTLESTYDYYKSLYTKKYGRPISHVEKNPARSEKNDDLMKELMNGKVRYVSTWEVSGDKIELSIIKAEEPGQGTVIIRYRDTVSDENKIKKALEDI